MQKTYQKNTKTDGKMGTIAISALVGAFVGITVWEMGKALNKEMKDGIKRQKAYDPHDEIYH